MPSCYLLWYDQCVLFIASFAVVTECMLKKILWPHLLEMKHYVSWPAGSDVETRNVDSINDTFVHLCCAFRATL